MKIAVDSAIRRYDNMAFKPKTRDTASSDAAAGKNIDRVIVGSDWFSAAEKRIAGEATQSVVTDVRAVTAPEKLESLKQQVQDGTYRPDADQIAARMLLWKGYIAE